MMYHGAMLPLMKRRPPLKDFLSGAKKKSQNVDERDIMARLKEYQRRKVSSDASSEA